jgi:hypothetical protein
MTRLTLALGALAMCAVASAQAPSTDLGAAAQGFGFRLGAFFPADNKLRDAGTTWTDFGVDYDLQSSLIKNGTTYLSVDWASKGFFGANHFLAATINQRFYGGSKKYAGGGAPYFFLGIGGTWADFKGSTGSTWLARGGVGTELNNGWFLEAQGVVSPKVNNATLSGVGVSVGYRFK